MGESGRARFEGIGRGVDVWPEVGSRMTLRVVDGVGFAGGWIEVEGDRYRYEIDLSPVCTGSNAATTGRPYCGGGSGPGAAGDAQWGSCVGAAPDPRGGTVARQPCAGACSTGTDGARIATSVWRRNLPAGFG